MTDYKVWTCKIVIAVDSELPDGFDSPPRMAAENAIENAGFKVLMNASGWGGSLSKSERDDLKRSATQGRDHIYYAGTLDDPETKPN